MKFGDRSLVDGLIRDGLWCSFGECHMGGHAEYTADRAKVKTRRGCLMRNPWPPVGIAHS